MSRISGRPATTGASEYFGEGQFHKALGVYAAKGQVHFTRTQVEARAELIKQEDMSATSRSE